MTARSSQKEPYKVDPQLLERVAAWAARRWWRRLPKHLQIDDLQQQAAVAILEAARSYEADKGPFLRYACCAAIRSLTGYVAQTLSPVTGSCHARHILAKTKAVPLDGFSSAQIDDDEISTTDRVEQLMLAEQDLQGPEHEVWRSEIRTTLWAAIGDIGPADVLMLIVAGELGAAQVSKELGLPPKALYRMTNEAKMRLEESREIWSLWSER